MLFRSLSGRIHSKLEITQIRDLLPPEQAEQIQDFKIQGQCLATTRFSGSLKKGSSVETEYSVSLENGSLKNEAKHIDWSGVSGELSMNTRGIEATDVRFVSAEKPYQLRLFVPKDKTAAGWAQIESQGLRVKIDYYLEADGLRIPKGEFFWPGVNAAFRGRLTHWADPHLSLKGEVEAALEQLPQLKAAEISGTLRGPFELEGPLNRWLDSEFKMDAESALVRVKRTLQMGKFQLQLRMKNRLVNLPYIHANFYGGTLGSRILFDLTKPKPFFDSKTYLNAVDLSGLGKDLTPPNLKLAGQMVAQVAARGEVGVPQSYRGQGAVSITQGYIFQSDKFKDMGNLPLVKVEGLDLVTFHEMNAEFNIHDQKLNTDNLTLMSEAVDISLKGHLTFDGALDMLMNIQYSEDVYRGAAETGGIVPLVVRQAGNFISQYHVRGSLNQPQFEKMLLPTGRIFN